jgi:predicted DNA-binding antitoxin AbrB/MazE fold protein
MHRTVRAVFDRGILRPLEHLDLPDREEVTIVILDDDDSSEEVAQIAGEGGAFEFLAGEAEEACTREDGEPV